MKLDIYKVPGVKLLSHGRRSKDPIGWPMSVLFVALLFVFIYIPMDIAEPISLYAFSFSALMLVMLFVVKAERDSLAFGAFLGIGSALSAWAITILAAPPHWMAALTFGLTALFIGYVIYTIVMRIVHEQAVSIHTVAAALSAYLLLGILWAMFYTAFAAISPGAFASNADLNLQISASVDRFPSLLYFSFTTLTTLGFGDIYPATMAARSLTVVEAIIGQIFLVVLVALLVSVLAAQRLAPKQTDLSQK